MKGIGLRMELLSCLIFVPRFVLSWLFLKCIYGWVVCVYIVQSRHFLIILVSFVCDPSSFAFEHRAEIKTLEAEKVELLKDLRLSDSQTNLSKDDGNVDKLNQLIDERGKIELQDSVI